MVGSERLGVATRETMKETLMGICDVAVEELLHRAPARVEQQRIAERLNGQTVLVTGAAGSIGSELCRRIGSFHPAAIVAFDIAESALFHLDLDMQRRFPNRRFHPEPGNIQNQQRIAEVMEKHRPAVVYHAAAYKHLPMMETHVFEAVENNVFGTWNAVEAAKAHGAAEFVLISSDKAVRPSSVMGASKRLAEMVALDSERPGIRCIAVRFGNVLGSSGSVIPIFREQIASGGPLTITHPEMRRYFMTVQEAAQLVLQASTMGCGGEVFELDMGEPAKIVDLARRLIALAGLKPEDIRIEFTGVRPGEKIFEEPSEHTSPTRHQRIRAVEQGGRRATRIRSALDRLRIACAHRDVAGLIRLLQEFIPDYTPSAHVLGLAETLAPTST